MKKLEARLILRERAVEALAELVAEEMPPTLVAAAAEQARESLSRRLAERGMTIDQYLEASGQQLDELNAEFERQAASQVRADLALRALADAEGITVEDQDLVAEIERRLARPTRTRGPLPPASQGRGARAATLGREE